MQIERYQFQPAEGGIANPPVYGGARPDVLYNLIENGMGGYRIQGWGESIGTIGAALAPFLIGYCDCNLFAMNTSNGVQLIRIDSAGTIAENHTISAIGNSTHKPHFIKNMGVYSTNGSFLVRGNIRHTDPLIFTVTASLVSNNTAGEFNLDPGAAGERLDFLYINFIELQSGRLVTGVSTQSLSMPFWDIDTPANRTTYTVNLAATKATFKDTRIGVMVYVRSRRSVGGYWVNTPFVFAGGWHDRSSTSYSNISLGGMPLSGEQLSDTSFRVGNFGILNFGPNASHTSFGSILATPPSFFNGLWWHIIRTQDNQEYLTWSPYGFVGLTVKGEYEPLGTDSDATALMPVTTSFYQTGHSNGALLVFQKSKCKIISGNPYAGTLAISDYPYRVGCDPDVEPVQVGPYVFTIWNNKVYALSQGSAEFIGKPIHHPQRDLKWISYDPRANQVIVGGLDNYQFAYSLDDGAWYNHFSYANTIHRQPEPQLTTDFYTRPIPLANGIVYPRPNATQTDIQLVDPYRFTQTFQAFEMPFMVMGYSRVHCDAPYHYKKFQRVYLPVQGLPEDEASLGSLQYIIDDTAQYSAFRLSEALYPTKPGFRATPGFIDPKARNMLMFDLSESAPNFNTTGRFITFAIVMRIGSNQANLQILGPPVLEYTIAGEQNKYIPNP